MKKLTQPPSLAAIATNKAADWAARRANWKLANRGDTRIAAERRFFKLQMKELRRDLMQADLLARRAEYVARREAARSSQININKGDIAEQRVQRAQLKEEKRLHREKENAKLRARQEISRLQAEKSRQRRADIQTSEREEWLQKFLEENDVSGTQMTSSFLAGNPADALNRKTWFKTEDPVELENRLNKMAVSYRKSPIDLWNDAARVSADEEQEMMFGRGSSAYSGLGASASSAAKAGTAAAAEDEPSSAEDTAAAEFTAAAMASYGRSSLGMGSMLTPEPPKTVVQLEKEHASEDGTAGFTRLDYMPHSHAPGGRLTLREKVALLDDEERPSAFKAEPRAEQGAVGESQIGQAFTQALARALSQNHDEKAEMADVSFERKEPAGKELKDEPKDPSK